MGKIISGENVWKDNKAVGMFLRQPRDHFIFFWLVSAVLVEIVRQENQIIYKVQFLKCLSFVCQNKWLSCLLSCLLCHSS